MGKDCTDICDSNTCCIEPAPRHPSRQSMNPDKYSFNKVSPKDWKFWPFSIGKNFAQYADTGTNGPHAGGS